MSRNQSDPMVSSSDVNGTKVYSPDGDHVGTVDHLMIDKTSGQVAYAIMHFGGFLGLGESEWPIPWKALRYSVSDNGFVTDITKEQLQTAPDVHDNWRADRDWEERTFAHYRQTPYWF